MKQGREQREASDRARELDAVVVVTAGISGAGGGGGDMDDEEDEGSGCGDVEQEDVEWPAAEVEEPKVLDRCCIPPNENRLHPLVWLFSVFFFLVCFEIRSLVRL